MVCRSGAGIPGSRIHQLIAVPVNTLLLFRRVNKSTLRFAVSSSLRFALGQVTMLAADQDCTLTK